MRIEGCILSFERSKVMRIEGCILPFERSKEKEGS